MASIPSPAQPSAAISRRRSPRNASGSSGARGTVRRPSSGSGSGVSSRTSSSGSWYRTLVRHASVRTCGCVRAAPSRTASGSTRASYGHTIHAGCPANARLMIDS